MRSERPVTALCTCRRSRRFPFCDTSHRRKVRHRRREDRPAVADRARGAARAAGAARPAVGGVMDRCAVGRDPAARRAADPYGEDLQLALYCLYELHYRGFAGRRRRTRVGPRPAARARGTSNGSSSARCGRRSPAGDDVEQVDRRLLAEPVEAAAAGVSHHLRRAGERWQLREYVAHRSLYHLKEADPQAWVIPRLHRGGQGGAGDRRARRVRRGRSGARARAAVRGDDARARARRRLRRLPGPRARGDARRGQPHVAVRAAPGVARRLVGQFAHSRAHLIAGVGPARPRHATGWACRPR